MSVSLCAACRKKLVALAGHKFIMDIAQDAMYYCKLRQQNMRSGPEDELPRYTLTLDDLSSTLQEIGVVLKKPLYYSSDPNVSKKK